MQVGYADGWCWGVLGGLGRSWVKLISFRVQVGYADGWCWGVLGVFWGVLGGLGKADFKDAG